jgi:hypothetical protein
MFPAMVRVPVREIDAVFADTRYETEPLPVPETPVTIVIHGALLIAVQTQPEAALTCAVLVAPAAGAVCETGDT